MSENMPSRDITGNCEGECRNLVREGEEQRQAAMEKTGVRAPEYYPNAPGAKSRNNAPGDLGGHV